MTPLADIPGAFEVLAARWFFAALSDRDAARLRELLAEAPSFENFDGPRPVGSRDDLARALSGRGDDVAYELVDVRAMPGSATCRFLLLVAGVPGVILLEALLGFVGERIASIRVHQPPSPAAN